VPRRSRYGSVSKRGSGRFTGYFTNSDGERKSLGTFDTEREAWDVVDERKVNLRTPGWINPDAGKVRFEEWASAWIRDRPELRPGSRNQYRSLFKNHLQPTFRDVYLSNISSAMVRAWHVELTHRQPKTSPAAYRLLRAIMNTAVQDDLIVKSPCQIRSAGVDSTEIRQPPAIEEVHEIIASFPKKLQLAAAVAAWGTLRIGEVLGLQRRDIDLEAGTVEVRRILLELPVKDGGLQTGPPKTKAGERTVTMPSSIVPLMTDHLSNFVAPHPAAHLFTGSTGQPLRPKALRNAFNKVKEALGLESLHFHDLRHFAATEAGNAGASLRDLMARCGWSNERMALRYLHTTKERDRQIAERLAPLVDLPAIEPVPDQPSDSSRPLASVSEIGKAKCTRKPTVTRDLVRPSGFEPETCGLRVRCSAVELEAHRRV